MRIPDTAALEVWRRMARRAEKDQAIQEHLAKVRQAIQEHLAKARAKREEQYLDDAAQDDDGGNT